MSLFCIVVSIRIFGLEFDFGIKLGWVKSIFSSSSFKTVSCFFWVAFVVTFGESENTFEFGLYCLSASRLTSKLRRSSCWCVRLSDLNVDIFDLISEITSPVDWGTFDDVE